MSAKSQRAFTMIELLVVISILSFLSSILFASLNKSSDKAIMAAGKKFEGSTFNIKGDSVAHEYDFENWLSDTAGSGGTTELIMSGNNIAFDTNSPVGGVGGQYITIPGDTYLRGVADLKETNYSVGFWFKTGATSGGLFQAALAGGPLTYDRDISLSGGRVCASVMVSSGPVVTEKICSSNTYSDDKWHYVLHSIGSTGQGLYVDGVKVNKGTAAASAFVTQNEFNIGYTGEFVNPTNVSIDRVRIFESSFE
jgi:prepilin-type N-terminal cleavage/methylation domain-containing protein